MRRRVPLAVSQFVSLVQETTGNVVPRARYGFLQELLERRTRAVGQPDVGSYVRRLAVGELEEEWQQLIPLITIKESYFFRAPQQFRVLTARILPRLLRARASSRKLRIWSAACARGEEPATLAMVLAESGLLGSWDWRILATDVDGEALGTAERGIYGERAVGQVPPELLEKYFTRRGPLWELSPVLRNRIRYRELNLARFPYQLQRETYDLIFLRNILIYFQRPLQRRVVQQVSRLLSRQGYLFLGASETLWQIHEGLHPVDLGVCFAYRHPRPGQEAPPPPRPQPRPRVVRGGEERRRPGAGEPPAADAGSTAAGAGSRPAVPPSRERTPSVLGEAGPKPPEPSEGGPGEEAAGAAGEPDVAEPKPDEPEPSSEPCAVQQRLAEAADAMADNRMDEAREILDRVLEVDPSEPAAHALEGFLLDLQSRPEEAVAAYRSALYLDPALYQARLLLADCLLRLGHEQRAHQQYREVLAVLGGRERELVALEALPLPGRERAERRCRQVLRGG